MSEKRLKEIEESNNSLKTIPRQHLHARVSELLAEVRALQVENNTFQHRLGNLLARIHRDGGHYIAEHGWDKACADADEKLVSGIVTISQENDSLRMENTKLREIAKRMHEALRKSYITPEPNADPNYVCHCGTTWVEGNWPLGKYEEHTPTCPARPDALESL